MIHYPKTSVEYINGYLEAIARLKDILTPYLGGTNQFFLTPKKPQADLMTNLQDFVLENEAHYSKYIQGAQLKTLFDKMALDSIEDWADNLPAMISRWTCDDALKSIDGKIHGYSLSQYLVQFLLRDFFGSAALNVYKLLPDNEIWHWADQMNETFVFETEDKVYLLHFGESS